VSDKRSEEAIVFLLEHGPANLHLVITSRSRPCLPMFKLALRNEATEIQAADLRFDLTESECFFHGLGINQADLRALLDTTEGWVAALQLAMISLRATGDRESLLRWIAGKHHAIGDYLAESVLNSLPPQLLDFLLQTSILSRFCGPLCSAVTGQSNGFALLEQAEQLQLFIIPLDVEREWFRYHHLFASHLQRRLERDQPERIRLLHLTAATWFEAQGFAEEAVFHALAAGDDEYAIRIVEATAMWFVERSYMATLLGLVSKLPQHKLTTRPALQTAIAWSNCLVHRSEQALAAVGHIEHHMATHGIAADHAIALEARVLRACVDIYADRIDSVEALLRPVMARAESVRPWVASVAANVLTYMLLHSHQYEAAIELQRASLPFHERTEGPFAHIYGICFAGMAAYEMGQHAMAEASFRDATTLARSQAGPHSHATRLAGAMLGKMYYEYNQLADAEPLLEDSIALGVEGGVADFSLASYLYYGRLLALRGEEERALVILDEGRNTARLLAQERLTASVAAERIRLLANGGEAVDLPEGDLVLGDSAAFPDFSDGITAQTWEAERIARARLALAQGRNREADALLDPLLEYTTLKGQRSLARCALILRSLARNKAGDVRGAEDAMLGALTSCDAPRAIRPFLDEGRGAIPILERLQARARAQLPGAPTRPVVGQIARILAAAGQPAVHVTERPVEAADRAAPRPDVANLSEPLKDREVEVLQLVGEGMSNKEIARHLGIGVDTVKWYLKAIYEKMGVGRRTQAICEARRLRLID
jgi:ATP/maltotriose-dependent transcriptional regulator MalT